MKKILNINTFLCFRAPTDCVQYFTGFSGTFQSYNWQTAQPQLLQAQNYFMCFRQEEGKTNIIYIFNN